MRITGAGAGPQWPERARGAGKPTADEGAPTPGATGKPEGAGKPDTTPPAGPPAHGVRRLLEAGHFEGKSNELMLAERFGVELNLAAPPADETTDPVDAPAGDTPPVDPPVTDPPADTTDPVVTDPPVIDPPADTTPPVVEPPVDPIVDPTISTDLTGQLLDALTNDTTGTPAAA